MATTNICVHELRSEPEIKTSLTNTIKLQLQHVRCVLEEWNRRKIERKQLLLLDEHMLNDIGISRVDAEFEARKPFWKE